MKYENFEKILIDRLSQCPELDVQIDETDLSQLNRPRQSTKPLVYVLYQGSTYDVPQALDVISQTETMTFEIIVFARRQRGPEGAYEAFETVTRKLLGYWEPGMRTPVVFQKFGYVSETNATYQYALQCSFTAYIVQACEEDVEMPPLIKKITNKFEQKIEA
jgi:hypothetical protein